MTKPRITQSTLLVQCIAWHQSPRADVAEGEVILMVGIVVSMRLRERGLAATAEV